MLPPPLRQPKLQLCDRQQVLVAPFRCGGKGVAVWGHPGADQGGQGCCACILLNRLLLLLLLLLWRWQSQLVRLCLLLVPRLRWQLWHRRQLLSPPLFLPHAC